MVPRNGMRAANAKSVKRPGKEGDYFRVLSYPYGWRNYNFAAREAAGNRRH
jgi:hypothetical protein